MKDGPTIQRIREVRHKISERFDYDAQKLVAYHIERQKEHSARFLSEEKVEPVE